MTETREESFIRLMNWPARGGSVRLKAWGRMMCRIACGTVIPRERAASICPRGIDWNG